MALPPSSRKEPDRTSWVWNTLKIILALVLGVFVLSRTDIGQLLALRERISLPWLAAVFVLYVSLTLLKALEYHFLLGRGVGYLQVLNVVIVQNAVSNFIATSAGIASYLTIFQFEHDVKLRRSALVFILAKVGDLISIWLLLLMASLSVWAQIQPFHLLVEILLTLLGGGVLAFLAVVLLWRRVSAALRRLLNWSRLNRFALVARAAETLEIIEQQPRSMIFRSTGLAIPFSMVYLLVTLAWLYAGLRAFSLQVPVIETVFVNTLLQLVSYIPIQVFGGLGVTETSMLYFYGPFHLAEAEIAAVLIGTRVLYYLANLLVLLYLPLQSLVVKPRKVL